MPRKSRLQREARARVIAYLEHALTRLRNGDDELPPMAPVVRQSFFTVLSDRDPRPETGDDAPFTWSK
jgi:hypothetical protein